MCIIQLGHSTHYRGLKLASSTLLLSILDVDFHSHIPQALRFYFELIKCLF